MKQNNHTTALVDSIYIYNTQERKNNISKIWAKYNMLPDNLTQSMGKLYQIEDNTYTPREKMNGLYDYTHNKETDYGRSITEKFLTVDGENKKVDIEDISKDAYKAWYNKAYQGKNYYDELSGYSHSFREKTNITYNDGNTYSGSDNGYSYIDYEVENNYESTLITPPSKLTHHYFNKPKKSDYKDNVEAYKAAVDDWLKKKGNIHQEDKNTVDKYLDYLNNESSHIDEPKTILTKTAKLFKENKINSLVSRLYNNDTILEYTDTSKSRQGRSRGRNLVNRNATYDNPFCRSWAAHHQYGDKSSLIRKSLINGKNVNESELITYNRPIGGENYLNDYSSLTDGFVRITPELEANNTGSGFTYNTKKCMFAIENLAWKDIVLNLSLCEEQKGPNGGRIMWFPPYDLQFQESSQANWNETNFIGRGEPIYTYNNTKRTGTLSFTMLIDHPSIVNRFNERCEDEKDKQDEDNDFLRFFAGCDVPMILEGIEQVADSDSNQAEGVTGKEIKSDNEVYLYADIYFPYGYIGTYLNSNFKKINGLDNFFDYLFMGVNSIVSEDKERWKGYEMSEKGITNDNEDSFESDNEITEACNNEFYYLITNLLKCDDISYDTENDCKDLSSNNLNSKTTKENYISFGDLYMLLYIWHKDGDKSEDIINYAIENGILKTGTTKETLQNNNIFTNNFANMIHNNSGLSEYFIWFNAGEDTYKEVIGNNQETTQRYRRDSVVNLLVKTKGIDEKNMSLQHNIDSNTTSTIKASVNRKEIKELRKVSLKFRKRKEGEEISEEMEQLVVVALKNTKRGLEINESEYFKNIEQIDNFAYQKIKEKVKYFDPAYHSINPEGFNARLTFLQQCMRQGHTLERAVNTDASLISTAGNMAFGRPPFCILRIGDFINTKILIRSLNIVYQNGNGIQWDINPEGIGIQPMFAKITMQIEIIGGQTLDAPIAKLNNAISFNYYANTGVYDDRADKAQYNATGVTYTKLYVPNIK